MLSDDIIHTSLFEAAKNYSRYFPKGNLTTIISKYNQSMVKYSGLTTDSELNLRGGSSMRNLLAQLTQRFTASMPLSREE